ncbi:MAG: peptidoglycan-binding domain-containing protein [Candidatus Omnitrophota bacterium]
MGQKKIWIIVGVIVLALIVIKVIATLSSRTPRISEQFVITEQVLPTENVVPVPERASVPLMPDISVSSPGATPPSVPALTETNPAKMPTAREIQAALKSAGFDPGAIDGKMGKKTKAAIMEFQTANDLIADGKVGPKTWSKLSRFLNTASALR